MALPPRSLASTVRLRIRIESPPEGVVFAIQKGKAELTPSRLAKPEGIVFEVPLRVRLASDGTGTTFGGEFVQGPPRERFVYINSGVRAGQAGSAWDRRAKLKLALVPDALLRQAADNAEVAVEARFVGTMADGGPVCASIPASSIAWQLVRAPG